MKVRELMEKLAQCDPEAVVLMPDYSHFDHNTNTRDYEPWEFQTLTGMKQGFSEDERDLGGYDMSFRETSKGYQCEAAVRLYGVIEPGPEIDTVADTVEGQGKRNQSVK